MVRLGVTAKVPECLQHNARRQFTRLPECFLGLCCEGRKILQQLAGAGKASAQGHAQQRVDQADSEQAFQALVVWITCFAGAGAWATHARA